MNRYLRICAMLSLGILATAPTVHALETKFASKHQMSIALTSAAGTGLLAGAAQSLVQARLFKNRSPLLAWASGIAFNAGLHRLMRKKLPAQTMFPFLNTLQCAGYALSQKSMPLAGLTLLTGVYDLYAYRNAVREEHTRLEAEAARIQAETEQKTRAQQEAEAQRRQAEQQLRDQQAEAARIQAETEQQARAQQEAEAQRRQAEQKLRDQQAEAARIQAETEQKTRAQQEAEAQEEAQAQRAAEEARLAQQKLEEERRAEQEEKEADDSDLKISNLEMNQSLEQYARSFLEDNGKLEAHNFNLFLFDCAMKQFPDIQHAKRFAIADYEPNALEDLETTQAPHSLQQHAAYQYLCNRVKYRQFFIPKQMSMLLYLMQLSKQTPPVEYADAWYNDRTFYINNLKSFTFHVLSTYSPTHNEAFHASSATMRGILEISQQAQEALEIRVTGAPDQRPCKISKRSLIQAMSEDHLWSMHRKFEAKFDSTNYLFSPATIIQKFVKPSTPLLIAAVAWKKIYPFITDVEPSQSVHGREKSIQTDITKIVEYEKKHPEAQLTPAIIQRILNTNSPIPEESARKLTNLFIPLKELIFIHRPEPKFDWDEFFRKTGFSRFNLSNFGKRLGDQITTLKEIYQRHIPQQKAILDEIAGAFTEIIQNTEDPTRLTGEQKNNLKKVKKRLMGKYHPDKIKEYANESEKDEPAKFITNICEILNPSSDGERWLAN